jgi:hypothetical protein
MVGGPLFRILSEDIQFQWETEDNTDVAILKEPLCNAAALISLHVSDRTEQIVVGVMPACSGGEQFCSRKTEIRTGTLIVMLVGSGTEPIRNMTWGNVRAVCCQRH